MGQMKVKVTYGTQTVTLPLIVVSGNGPNLFGRDKNSVELEANLHGYE